MEGISSINLFLLWGVQFTSITASKDSFICITCYSTKTYAQITYTNPMFCTYVLHKQHGQFFRAHSQIFFLNNIGDTIFFNSTGKMSHIFGSKLDIVSEPYMTVLILLPCSTVLF